MPKFTRFANFKGVDWRSSGNETFQVAENAQEWSSSNYGTCENPILVIGDENSSNDPSTTPIGSSWNHPPQPEESAKGDWAGTSEGQGYTDREALTAQTDTSSAAGSLTASSQISSIHSPDIQSSNSPGENGQLAYETVWNYKLKRSLMDPLGFCTPLDGLFMEDFAHWLRRYRVKTEEDMTSVDQISFDDPRFRWRFIMRNRQFPDVASLLHQWQLECSKQRILFGLEMPKDHVEFVFPQEEMSPHRGQGRSGMLCEQCFVHYKVFRERRLLGQVLTCYCALPYPLVYRNNA